MTTYIDVTQEAGRAFFMDAPSGPVEMLNMLRFRETADYSAFPALAPESPISGREAYARYAAHTKPFLQQAGSEVIYAGQGAGFLIGPQEARWDLVLVVRHQSIKDFMAFATHEAYLAGAGHRSAALEDSRLLPLQQNHTILQ